MTNSQRLATVRDRLNRWIADQSNDPEADPCDRRQANSILSESILIRDGFYCGRRFNFASHRAVWFLEEDSLKIYAAGGELECVLSSEEINEAAVNEAEIHEPVVDDSHADVIRMPSAEKEAEFDQGEDDLRRAA